MEIVEILKQHSANEDPFGKGFYTVRYADGTTGNVDNPLTAGMSQKRWYAYCAERMQRIRESRQGGETVTAGIKAMFGIQDEHHPEPYE